MPQRWAMRLFDECQCSGCGAPTRDGKPFCIDHIEAMPYAKWLIAIVEQRDAHIGAINQGNRVELDQRMAGEILAVIVSAGTITPQRIAHICGFPYRVVTVYVESLVAAGKLTAGKTRRGSPIVKLIVPPEAKPRGKNKN